MINAFFKIKYIDLLQDNRITALYRLELYSTRFCVLILWLTAQAGDNTWASTGWFSTVSSASLM